ncbi:MULTISPECIES: c-type cytochrome [Pantoea]|jgi:mono/diheme cytochrome c family protein|uniref:Cytochrome c, mono-and diheme variants n=2 Tax=Candidatus Pantoea symbiotica TaxID=1884370 RepID=A0A1I3XJB5_9GAMM|nr:MULTISPECIES: cytochrome c [Pantoea]KAJ9434358.1 cytochrome c [Pantoea sp. YR343]MCW6033014.1 cytochrome c [Pantoea sp. JK]SFK19612.1 Cytochrome c, mono-and diheme variants [Pantoea symbiotica]SFU80145.1 Cytochrome c, mono-and diheme variants [Pantoea sp. YR525]
MKLKSLLIANAVLLGSFAVQAHAEDEAQLIKQGEYLSRLGDCMACHTVSGKGDYAGGLAIESNLGTIYSTNITPDKEHGIGNYSEQQFSDAVRKGVLPNGSRLYPAMPYPDYAKISDADMHALYVYFMKGVKPSSEQPPETDLSFPFSQRWGMRFWNWAFTSDKPFQPIGGASEEVNRGAYIVESLGHCGSCHTPRGLGMNEKALDSGDDQFLAGGSLNNWDVPSLRGLPRWSEQEIVDYLQTGRNDKAAVGGEMKSVIEHSSSHMTDADLKAIASYLKFIGGNPALQAYDVKKQQATEAKLTAAKGLSEGERLYIDNCGACHFVTGKGAPGIFPELDQATIVNAKDPSGLIHTILAGAQQPSTEKAPSTLAMPGFAKRLDDDQVAKLATFIRQGWSNNAPAVTKDQVAEVRKTLK